MATLELLGDKRTNSFRPFHKLAKQAIKNSYPFYHSLKIIQKKKKNSQYYYLKLMIGDFLFVGDWKETGLEKGGSGLPPY